MDKRKKFNVFIYSQLSKKTKIQRNKILPHAMSESYASKKGHIILCKVKKWINESFLLIKTLN